MSGRDSDPAEGLRQAVSEAERLSLRLARVSAVRRRGTGRLLLFIARDHNPLVAARVLWRLTVNACCDRLGRAPRYRRPFKGAGLNMEPFKRALERAMPRGKK